MRRYSARRDRRMGEAWEIGSNHKNYYSAAYLGDPGSGEVGGVPKVMALHRSYTLKWSLDLGSSLGLACYGAA